MLKRILRVAPLELDFEDGISYNSSWGGYKAHTSSEMRALLHSQVLALCISQRLQVQQGWFPASFKGKFPVYDSNVSTYDNPVYLECKNPIKPAHKDFKRRSAAGEILMSDFHNWQCIITYRNGQIVEKVDPSPLKSYEPIGRYLIGTTKGDYILLNDRWYRCRVISTWYYETLSAERTPKQLGWVDPSYEYLDSFLRRQVDAPKVQEVLADHNDRTVDALTSLAEMPETVRSIIDAAKVILRMYVDARKKAFRLQNRVSEWKNAKTSDRNQRQVLRNIRELNDAIADVWLNFRYNIKPNVYLIEDMLKAIGAPESLFLRDRSRVISRVPFFPLESEWTSKKEKTDLTERVLIKSRLDLGSNKLNTQFSFNAFKTAWELIPLSFVVDWVLSIGDFLSSSFPPANAEQGATYSWKVDDEFSYVHEGSGASVSIKYTAYKREVIDPQQFCKIYWVPDINIQRQRDAVALTWKIFIQQHFRKLS